MNELFERAVQLSMSHFIIVHKANNSSLLMRSSLWLTTWLNYTCLWCHTSGWKQSWCLTDECPNLTQNTASLENQPWQPSFSRMLPLPLLFPKMKPATSMKVTVTMCFGMMNYAFFHVREYEERTPPSNISMNLSTLNTLYIRVSNFFGLFYRSRNH